MSTLSGDEPELTLGDSNEYVTQLQDRLRALRLFDRQPDGSYDGATEAAVQQFQSDRGLTVDGAVGPKTWAELDEQMLNQGLQYNPYASPGEQRWDLPPHEATHTTQTAEAAAPHTQWDGEKWMQYDEASGQWVAMPHDAGADAPAEPHPVPHIDNVHPAVREDARFSSFHDFMRETHG